MSKKVLTLRVESTLIEKLNACTEEMKKQSPMPNSVKRAAVAIHLLTNAVDEMLEAASPRKVAKAS